jgi:hypothetical protein
VEEKALEWELLVVGVGVGVGAHTLPLGRARAQELGQGLGSRAAGQQGRDE